MIWIDFLVLALLAYFLILGYFQGFIKQFIDLTGLVISFALAFFLSQDVSKFLDKYISVPAPFSVVLSFIIIWFIFGVLYFIATIFVYRKIPKKANNSRYNHVAGVLPAFVKGVVATGLLLALFLILPLPTKTKEDIANSQIGGPLVSRATSIQLFGKEFNDTLAFLTVKPESEETVNLGFRETNYKVDETSEKRMLALVNKERESRGLGKLVMDTKLRDLARQHSIDMFENGYFSHTDRDGKSPFDRMNDAKITFLIAGENLALAPSVDIAHDGLMNSPGHRANILTPEFGRVGIGVVSSETYGRMFSQEFTD